MAVPLNLRDAKAHHIFGGGNNQGNIATQPNKLKNCEKVIFIVDTTIDNSCC